MQKVFNVYCDESCHLEKDRQPAMVLGAVWCPEAKSKEIADRLRDLKREHGMPAHFELKWGRVSEKKLPYFMAVLDFFFDDDDLAARLLIAPKDKLDHKRFEGQDHDKWYYKMYFLLLRWLLLRPGAYRVYIDIKDTRGKEKIEKLHDILANDRKDFDRTIIRRVMMVRSEEVEQVQLADFLCGITGYAFRGLNTSAAKLALVKHMEKRMNASLVRTSSKLEEKVNIFHWLPQTAAE